MLFRSARDALHTCLLTGVLVGAGAAEGDGPEEDLVSARAALLREDWDAACMIADRLLEADPDEARAHLIIGRCQVAYGQHDDARESLLLALDLGLPAQQEPQAWYWLGRAEEARGDIDAAADAFAMLLTSFPGSAEAALVEARYREERPPVAVDERRECPAGPRSFLELEGGGGYDSNPRRLSEEEATERRPLRDLFSLALPLIRLRYNIGQPAYNLLEFTQILAEVQAATEPDIEDDWYLYGEGTFGVRAGDGVVSAALTGELIDYHEEDRLDFASVAPELRLAFTPGDDDHLDLEATVGLDWLEYDAYAWWGELELDWQHDWGESWATWLGPHGRVAWHREEIDEPYDGYAYGLEAGLAWFPAPAWWRSVELVADGTDHRYEGESLDFLSLSAEVVHRFGGGAFYVEPGFTYEYRDYRDDPYGREDHVYTAGAALQIPLGNYVRIRLDGGYTWRRSDLELYDYERWFAQGGFAVEF